MCSAMTGALHGSAQLRRGTGRQTEPGRRISLAAHLPQQNLVVEVDAFRDELARLLTLTEQIEGSNLDGHRTARRRHATVLTLVRSGDRHFADGRARTVVLTRHRDVEIRYSGLDDAVELLDSREAFILRSQRPDVVIGPLILDEGIPDARPIVVVLPGDVLADCLPLSLDAFLIRQCHGAPPVEWAVHEGDRACCGRAAQTVR